MNHLLKGSLYDENLAWGTAMYYDQWVKVKHERANGTQSRYLVCTPLISRSNGTWSRYVSISRG
jgi:hypothetical protein